MTVVVTKLDDMMVLKDIVNTYGANNFNFADLKIKGIVKPNYRLKPLENNGLIRKTKRHAYNINEWVVTDRGFNTLDRYLKRGSLS